MPRARYQDAVDWIAGNDDNTWLEESLDGAGEESPLSVTAALVADIWGKDEATIRRDLRRALKRIERETR